MVSKSLVFGLLLAFYTQSAIASPVGAQVNSDELVIIPGGMIEKLKVHIVPDGGKIVHSATEVRLLDAEGKVLHASAALASSKPRYNLNLLNASMHVEHVIGPRNLQSATILALVQAPSVSSFGSNWILPPLPQVNSGQLLMYSSILAPVASDAFIQPTLQYGVSAAGGGPFWSVASWFITPQQVFVTNLTRITQNAGLTLGAFIINQDQFSGTATTHAWLSVINGFPRTAMNIQTTETFNVAIEALQITNATTIANLPNQPTDIQRIVILTSSGQQLFPLSWSFLNDTADGISIIRNPNTIPSNEVLFFKYGR